MEIDITSTSMEIKLHIDDELVGFQILNSQKNYSPFLLPPSISQEKSYHPHIKENK